MAVLFPSLDSQRSSFSSLLCLIRRGKGGSPRDEEFSQFYQSIEEIPVRFSVLSFSLS